MENRRKLGKSDLMVSPITFGGNVFGWTLNEKESFRILDAFVDAGFNFIDTADTYSLWAPGNSGGESETIIGNWMKERGNREKVLIATKVGGEITETKKGLKPDYIKRAVEESLTRLQTDHIDLYQSHYDDLDTPVSETMTAFNELVEEGKVRYIGTSNLSADRIKESNQFARDENMAEYVSIQPHYNLYERQRFEDEYLPLIEEEKMAVINYYALASGFLTGKYRNEKDLGKSPRGGGIKKYLDERGQKILRALDEVSADLGVPQAQIAIAWLLHKPFITSPIASATSLEQLDDLIGAASLKLSSDHVELLDKASGY
ncbi:MAG TPA: aldo/keto reductase [Balneolaceae bacterium]|nr:aldo/keto reductase [Balneolaceae bacterium]